MKTLWQKLLWGWNDEPVAPTITYDPLTESKLVTCQLCNGHGYTHCGMNFYTTERCLMCYGIGEVLPNRLEEFVAELQLKEKQEAHAKPENRY